jgi:hypothetical protein
MLLNAIFNVAAVVIQCFLYFMVWPQDTQGANGEMAGGDQRIEVA